MRQRLMGVTALMLAALLSACAQAQPPAAPAPSPATAPARPALQDMEPDVTRQVQDLLADAAQARLAPDVLTERARSALAPARLQALGNSLKACGTLGPLELLDRQTKGEDRMYVYRAPCAGKPLLVEIDFGKGSRVSRLEVRRQ